MTRKRAGQVATTSRRSNGGIFHRAWRTPLADRRPKLRLLRVEDFEARTMLTATISGTKFTDVDNSQTINAGDTPLAGITIEIFRDNGDGTFNAGNDTLEQSDITDALGQYSFPGLTDGRYFIREVTPGGSVQTVPAAPGFYTVDVIGDFAIPVGPTGNAIVIDEFDDPTPAEQYQIGLDDADPFLFQTAAAGVLGGQRDVLIDVIGPVTPFSVGGQIGEDIFSVQNGPGAVVNTTLQYDGVDAEVGVPLNNGTFAAPIDVTDGGTTTGIRIGFANVDSGGIGDPPLPYTITLIDDDGEIATFTGAVADSSGPISTYADFSLFTAAGTFEFDSVSRVEFLFNPAFAADFIVDAISLVGERSIGFDFANRVTTAPLGSIAGVVYIDLNNNGSQDLGEAGIPGVPVALTGSAVQDTVTDANGAYIFDNLPAGTYTVTETQPAAFLDGIDTLGTAGGDDTVNDVFSNIVLTAGQDAIDYLFGELPPATLSGTVYVDSSNDGIKDGGEIGIEGATVTLTGTDDLGNPVDIDVLTDVNGNYTFTDLRPGTYEIVETQPATFLDGIDTVGTVGAVTRGTVGNDTITNIVLNPDEDGVNYNFGEIVAATLSGFVYNDLDNDGIKEAGEPGIQGVTVTLTGTDDLGAAVDVDVLTDANGLYIFTGLRPSSIAGYTVTETQPATFLDGLDTAGTVGAVTRGTAANDVITGILLNPDDDGIDYNFGEIEPGSIAGFVYVDINNNGIKDVGEAGIPGVDVELTGDDDLGPFTAVTVTTDANGAYVFNNLRPGEYSVEETQPAGFVDGQDTPGSEGGDDSVNDIISEIIIGQGVDATDYNFGELNPASLAGFVYVDANNNGTKDGGEAGIPTVTVTLTGTNDLGAAVNVVDTTDANGAYSFENLRPGTYIITETQPATFLDGQESLGTAGGTLGADTFTAITLDQDEDGINYNFGELNPASISGFVYSDLDNDGVKDPAEVGITPVIITLTGTNDLGAAVNLTDTTDASGAYSFDNLRPGTYTVTEGAEPAGFLDGKDTAGTSGGVTTVDDVISGIVLDQDEDSTGNNFGELVAATLSGFVYNDLDNDGIKEAGEAGIAGVTVVLSGTNDLGAAVNQTATTDANGAYTFTGLRPSSTAGYTVAETQPATFLDGQDRAGTVGGVTRGTAGNDVITGILLNPDDDGINYNFGEIVFSSLTGFVYHDTDNDGIKDAGESGIQSVIVTLTGTDDLGAAVNRTATTDGNGAYTFANMRPGSYTLVETQPAAFLDGKDTPGTVNGATEGVATPPDSITSIDLTAGQSGINYNFGEILAAALSGFVYADVNANGTKDGVEAGIPGVTVRLTGTDDLGQSVNTTLTTSQNGSYSFGNLRPSSGAGYTITETHPIAFIDGTESIGSQGGTVGNDVLSAIVLNQGVSGINNNFGELGLIGELVSKKPYITPSPFQNRLAPTDVNSDFSTTALDALIVINALNAPGGPQLPANSSVFDFFMDVNGDTELTPLDALMVINMINRAGGTVTPTPAGGGNNQLQAQNMSAEEAFALAVDQAMGDMDDDDEVENRSLNPFARGRR